MQPKISQKLKIGNIDNYLIISSQKQNQKYCSLNTTQTLSKKQRSYSAVTIAPLRQSYSTTNKNNDKKSKQKKLNNNAYYRIVDNNSVEIGAYKQNGKMSLYGFKFSRVYEADDNNTKNSVQKKLIKSIIRQSISNNEKIDTIIIANDSQTNRNSNYLKQTMKKIIEHLLSDNYIVTIKIAQFNKQSQIQKQIKFLNQLKFFIKHYNIGQIDKICIKWNTGNIVLLMPNQNKQSIINKLYKLSSNNKLLAIHHIQTINRPNQHNVLIVKQKLKKSIQLKQCIVDIAVNHKISSQKQQKQYANSSYPTNKNKKSLKVNNISDDDEQDNGLILKKQNIYLKLKLKQIQSNFQNQANQYIGLMKQTVNQLSHQLQTAKTANKQLQSQNTLLLQQNDKLNTKLKQLQSDNKLKQYKIQKMQIKDTQISQQYRDRGRELIRQVSEYKKMCEDMKIAYRQLQQKYQATQNKLNKSEKQLSKIKGFSLKKRNITFQKQQ